MGLDLDADFKCPIWLMNENIIPSAKLPAFMFIFWGNVDIGQVMHKGGLIQAANPKKGTSPAYSMLGGLWDEKSSAPPATAVRIAWAENFIELLQSHASPWVLFMKLFHYFEHLYPL